MAITYKKIASVTVGSGGAANIQFTSIPGTYTDLLIKLSTRDDSNDGSPSARITFNGSTANEYTNRRVVGFSGTSTGSFSDTSIAYAYAGFNTTSVHTASTFSNNEIYIPNYAGSTNKSFSMDGVIENNSASVNALGLYAQIWSNTAAITSVLIKPATANFVQYSTAVLYGISKS
jgi:hypothetical protein